MTTLSRRRPLDDASELCRLGAVELAARYRDRSLSPVEVAKATLDRAQAIQPTLNPFTHIDGEGALAAARASEARWREGKPASAIDGVPTTIKDIVWVRGWTVRYGTKAVPGVNAAEDAPTVGLLRAAGAVLLGLTATPEFGWKGVTDSALTGITRNPWNPDRTPGGSSGGAVVAAATGAGVLHLGTDGGGSIRIPAAFSGVVGHKQSFGRVPAYPASPFGTVAHVGPIARSVADVALMLQVLSARDLRDWNQNPLPMPPITPLPTCKLAGLRVGVWSTPPNGKVAPDVAANFQDAQQRLSKAGAHLTPITLPDFDVWQIFTDHWFAGAAARLSTIPAEQLKLVDPGLRQVGEAGAKITAVQLIAAQTQRTSFAAAFDQLLAQYDVLISPAMPLTAFGVGLEVPPGSGQGRWSEWAGFSYPINLSQAPACVVPSGFGTDGMPIGLQIIGRRTEDAAVLAAAAAMQSVLEF